MIWMFAIAWLLNWPLGLYISTVKHRGGAEASLLTLIYGPLGVIVLALLPDMTPPHEPKYVVSLDDASRA